MGFFRNLAIFEDFIQADRDLQVVVFDTLGINSHTKEFIKAL